MTDYELAVLGYPRFKEANLRVIEAVERRLETPLPQMRQIIEKADVQDQTALLLVLDLLGHFIDTEEKLATKVLDHTYFEAWMKTVRRRLKKQKAATTPTKRKKT